MKIAGTRDGRAILVMSGSHVGNTLAAAFTLGIVNRNSGEVFQSLKAVEKLFDENRIRILKRSRMGSSITDGFFLETDQDCYLLLNKYSDLEGSITGAVFVGAFVAVCIALVFARPRLKSVMTSA